MKLAIEIFSTAKQFPDGPEREAFLKQACGSEHDLLNEVKSLLQVESESADFLCHDAVGTPLDHSDELLGSIIDRYQLVEHLGEGGFADVYRVRQMEPVHRELAMKIVKPGLGGKEFEARFLSERKVLEILDHANIAQIFDAGYTSDGRSYFIMELVIGVPITQYCDDKKLPIPARLDLFITVCKAVRYAHQQGILHRDLKPSNIVVVESEGQPIPKIIDFGIAKALGGDLKDHALVTQVGLFVGTPAYMSPEQISSSSENLDTRSDIYALGILLYELIAGMQPFKLPHDAALLQLQNIICHVDPDKPSARLKIHQMDTKAIAEHRSAGPIALIRMIKGDLDWIVMKAIEKDRSMRYQAVDELVDDIHSHLNNDPVKAGAPGRVYRVRKYVKRHRIAATVLAIILPVCAIAYGLSLMGFAQARKERIQALRNSYESNLHVAYENWRNGQGEQAKALLASFIPEENDPDFRNWEWHYLLSLCYQDTKAIRAHSNEIDFLALSPDGIRLASTDIMGTTRIWDTVSWELLNEIPGPDSLRMEGFHMAWSPDGKLLARSSHQEGFSIWNTTTWEILQSVHTEFFINHASWSPDGGRIATCEWSMNNRDRPRAVSVWDVASGQRIVSIYPENPAEQLQTLAWSPDGSVMAAGGENGKLYFWDGDTYQLLYSTGANLSGIRNLEWSPDSQYLAVASDDASLSIWARNNWTLRHQIKSAHQGMIDIVKWSTDGTQLVSAGNDGKVKIWDSEYGYLLRSLPGHNGFYATANWHRDGIPIYSMGKDGSINQWSLSSLGAWHEIDGVGGLAFHPYGEHLATAVAGATDNNRSVNHYKYDRIHVLDALMLDQQDAVSLEDDPTVFTIAWSPDGQLIAVGTELGENHSTIRVIDLSANDAVFEATTAAGINSVAWDPSGNFIACCIGHPGDDDADEIIMWDVRSGERVLGLQRHDGCGRTSYLTSVAWHPDGDRIAAGCAFNHVLVWDVESGSLVHSLSGNERVNARVQNKVAWSPAGDRLGCGFGDGSIQIWDGETGDLLRTLIGHSSNTLSLSWSPDGERILSLSRDQTIRIWSPDTGHELLQLPMAVNDISIPYPVVAWSPNGKLIGAAASNKLLIFDASSGYELAQSELTGDLVPE